MNKFCSTILCGLMVAPVAAQAEVEFGGEVVLGYGETAGTGSAYGIVTLNATDTQTIGSVDLTWSVQARGRTDQDDIGKLDADNLDASVELDFGTGGKLGLSTFSENPADFPWADGELFNRGSIGVMPTIAPRFDGVADTQIAAGAKSDPDLLLTYSNKFGKVGVDLVANPLGTFDGTEVAGVAKVEGTLKLPTSMGIYSVRVNDLKDAEMQVVFPMPKQGLTLIARHAINEGDWDDSRTNLVAMYRTKDMGIFKGAMLTHAMDANNKRTVLNLNFGYDDFGFKIAGDTDGDMAVEASYAFTENTSLLVGWDNGHDARNGFDDAAIPAPAFAPARDSAFEVAFVHSF